MRPVELPRELKCSSLARPHCPDLEDVGTPTLRASKTIKMTFRKGATRHFTVFQSSAKAKTGSSYQNQAMLEIASNAIPPSIERHPGSDG
ncbi:hypothetical protein K443DRAFT_552669 [Laccaria amethystina LaAM-08-1]|uniref:Uncharacterized protein n=1 Tax=Laccaria amethystina LaAM-08-1 TaxID=1095629 RepID=A0A0C9XJL3_9AGAR|nr:hypothetical protein K443DRAFT_552669 [Laccaria amethystina LaAM-08-1]